LGTSNLTAVSSTKLRKYTSQEQNAAATNVSRNTQQKKYAATIGEAMARQSGGASRLP